MTNLFHISCSKIAFILLIFSSLSCSSYEIYHTVSFDFNGGIADSNSVIVKEGKKVELIENVTRDGFIFLAWYTDEDLTNLFDTNLPITEDISLYAKWERNFDIPDDNFRALLKNLIPNAFDREELLKTNHPDVSNIKELNIPNKNIASLDGIQFFTALTTLVCNTNQLSNLNLSKNKALMNLECSLNKPLTSLDLSENTALVTLNCSNNSSLTTLILPKSATLKELNINSNKLLRLDLSENIGLTSLKCINNELVSLNLSKNTALINLDCNTNKLKSLDLSENIALKTLICNDNSLTDLDLSKNTALTNLKCSYNKLNILDLRGIRKTTPPSSDFSIDFNGDNLNTIRVHESIKDDEPLKRAKMNIITAVNIEVYTADKGSADYTKTCSDYDPNNSTCITP